MEQIPGIAYLHPLWQFAALIWGLYVAALALPNIDNPNFKVRRHERHGRILLIMILAGAVFGRLSSASLPQGTFRMPGHIFMTVFIVALVIIGAIFGYQGGRLRLRTRTGMMRAHPWFVILVLALMFAQALIGIGSKGLRLIKF
jgi:hypothetical protein